MFYEMIGFVSDGSEPSARPLPEVPPEKSAFYLDFDGVLVDLAPTPDGIEVPETLTPLLNDLHARTGGAVAIVSGRATAALRRHLPGWTGIVVGSHGGEIDRGDGPEPMIEVDSSKVEAITRMVDGFAASDPAYIAEPKPTGVVLHFRRKPELRGAAWQMLDHTLCQFPGFHIHHSKMAFEVRPDGVGKENAVKALSGEAPFAGRTPFVLGDDVTDEPAMAWANSQGGHSIKVGEGQSCAQLRVPGPAEVHRLLRAAAHGAADAPA